MYVSFGPRDVDDYSSDGFPREVKGKTLFRSAFIYLHDRGTTGVFINERLKSPGNPVLARAPQPYVIRIIRVL